MNTDNQILSIVIPILNEEDNIPILLDEIETVIRENNLNISEIIIVNDGSIDNSEQVLGRIAQKHS